ncbi:MAG: prepilin peptidase [Actinobacteria bacterium]|nr:prepilin peptidase [Actinomycetota bacterium]
MEPADAALAACGIAAAFAVASFTGVIVDRLPKPLDEPNAGGDTWDTNPWREVLGGRSHCLTCGAPVAAYDNIPVVSYLVLLGRCRSCKQRFGIGHVLLELLIPALLILMTIRVGVRWMLIPALVAVPVGVAIAAIDFRTLIVPTRLVWPAAAVSFVTGSGRGDRRGARLVDHVGGRVRPHPVRPAVRDLVVHAEGHGVGRCAAVRAARLDDRPVRRARRGRVRGRHCVLVPCARGRDRARDERRVHRPWPQDPVRPGAGRRGRCARDVRGALPHGVPRLSLGCSATPCGTAADGQLAMAA